MTDTSLRPGRGRRRIARQSLHADILVQLRDMIVEGELAQGTRINETHLGELLGVSRTPLREAIKYLASEGLVELVPSRGAVVKTFGYDEVLEMMTVLRSLEELGARLACEKASDADIAAVREMHNEMVACYERGDRLKYYKLNQAIHTAIAEMSANRTLADMQSQLQMRLKRIRFLGHEQPAHWQQAVHEHEDMMTALEARDGNGLAEALGRHLQHAWDRVDKLL